MHSADDIMPEFQNLSVGDTFTLGDNGPTMRVAILDPARALVFNSTDGHWIWAFALYPDGNGTRQNQRPISAFVYEASTTGPGCSSVIYRADTACSVSSSRSPSRSGCRR
ncbi:hypothetical protein BOX37_12550 [Nocardia mangyaensis]|uniref:Uncharacterized protein n=1 Tax=Nocardia mangyaensis TaxID=2213200 RepID=A0A1J0VRH1_9NOCA|nr:hypothetical protein BOX37_12550 [Nocardia mangyaensis]